MSVPKFDFGFGDSHAVRSALFTFLAPYQISEGVVQFGYAPKEGDTVLENFVREMIKASTGLKYENIVITAGAHMGGAASLLALEKRNGAQEVYFDELHFLRYPQLVQSLNLLRASKEDYLEKGSKVLRLTASPSNPTGELQTEGREQDTVWDACYHNEIYTSPLSAPYLPYPAHAVMVGSLGKITGLNGLRLGWVATNDKSLAARVQRHHYDLTLGPSTTSMGIAKNFFRRVELPAFYQKAYGYLCDNRSQLSKLEYLFADKVPDRGMFWFTELDVAARKLLEKVGVTVIEGFQCGGTENQVRLTLGQTRELTKDMVKAVLREDGK